MIKTAWLPFILIIAFLSACTNTTKKSMEPSVVEPILTDKASSSNTIIRKEEYCLYYPGNRNEVDSMDLILFFDPHAKGSIPVIKYQQLAEQEKFILAGSNRSENNLSNLEYRNIFQSLLQHLKEQENIRYRHIILAGFSGGASAAYQMAEGQKIKGLIYCGASPNVDAKLDLQYIGFAGKADFNYAEILSFDEQIPTSKRHQLIEWDGGHSWPNASQFQTALEILKRENYVQQAKIKMDTELKAELKQENELRKKYRIAMDNRDMNWWKTEMQIILEAQRGENAWMYKRIQSYLSVVCYMQTESEFRKNDLIKASEKIRLYRLIDAQNPDASYFEALLFIKENNTEAAIDKLNEACKKGFNDIKRLEREAAFQKLNGDPRYESVKVQCRL